MLGLVVLLRSESDPSEAGRQELHKAQALPPLGSPFVVVVMVVVYSGSDWSHASGRGTGRGSGRGIGRGSAAVVVVLVVWSVVVSSCRSAVGSVGMWSCGRVVMHLRCS